VRTWSTTADDDIVVRSGWVLEWLPTGCASAILAVASGLVRMKSPVRKNVAGVRVAASVARIDDTPVLLAPPSKVNTATLDVVGTAAHRRPALRRGLLPRNT
jgi:hypothetical protein